MLVIRTEQMEQMAAAKRAELATTIERELRAGRPDLVFDLERIRAAIDAAAREEITGSRSLRLYVELALQYDLNGDPVVRRIFSNTIEPPLLRMRRARAWLRSRGQRP